MARNGQSSTRLYVGRLSNVTRDVDLDEEFRRFGRIRDVELKSGFAFVEFYDPRDADHALSMMNGRVIHGSPLVVQFARLGPRGAGPGRGGGSGRYGDEGRDAFYDDRHGGGRAGFEDRNFADGPRSRSRDLSPDRYGNARGYGDRGIGEADAQYFNSGYARSGPPPIPLGGGGRGRGRGRVRGGRELCYNCGRVGHIARECREGDWSNRCYECGQYGHIIRQCPELRRNPYRSRSRSPRGPSYRPRRRSRSPPSPDSNDGRRSPPPYRRRSRSPPNRSGRRSPSNDYRRRYSRSPDHRRGRSRSPYVSRRDRRSREYETKPNENRREPSPVKETPSERHADDNDEHRSSDQKDNDGGVPAVPYNTDNDNGEQKGVSDQLNQEEEGANINVTESFDDDDDPVNEDEDMALPARNSSPQDEAADGAEEEKFDFEPDSGESSESD